MKVPSSVLAAALLLWSGCARPPGGADDGGASGAANCELPTRLDFDTAPLGGATHGIVTVTNTSSAALEVELLAISSNSSDADAFTFDDPALPGTFTLEPGAWRAVELTFQPTEARDYLALLRLQLGSDCPAATVRLYGMGVSALLAWAPSPLAFGYVIPGTSADRALTVTNHGPNAVRLSSLAVIGADFSLPSSTAVTVPAATLDAASGTRTPGTAPLTVRFTPSVFGPRVGTLTFDTSVPQQASGSVTLRGSMGGPVFQVQPSALAIGRVAYQPGVDLFTTRKLVVRNVGTSPSPADAAANLHLGKGGMPPYFTVTPMGGNSTADELCLGAWDDVARTCLGTLPGYLPATGIGPDPAAALEIPVRLTPKSLGPRQFKVVLFSDDRNAPEVTVMVTAEAKTYPPCNYSLTPSALNFGLLSPLNAVTLELTLANLGTAAGDVCLLSALDLAPGSDPTFTLAAPVFDRELGPGEVLKAPVRARPLAFTPTGTLAVQGAVRVQLSSMTAPQRDVPLTAKIGTSCLTISPGALDFGTVQLGCNSATRTFSVRNGCSTAVTVSGFDLLASPEFSAVNTAGIAPGTVLAAGAAPVTFSLKYQPTNVGADLGTFALHAVQGAGPVDLLTPLTGAGAATGANTNDFPSGSGKTDVLIVVDDSCSMSDKQLLLASNVSSLLSTANANGIDYQVGVATTDMSSPLRRGRLVGGVVSSAQSNAAAMLAQQVQVGINGSAVEESASVAVAALTAPLVSGPNAGLVRPDAALGIIVFTDAADQSPQPFTAYVNALLNVKGAQRPDLLSYSGFTPTLPSAPANCSYDASNAASDGKHTSMITALRGVSQEICNSDFAVAATLVGDRAFRSRPSYMLVAVPDGTQPMTVKVDGVVVPPVDGNGLTVWTFDPLTNSLEFSPNAQPPLGKTVTVDYQVACIP